MSLLLQKLNHFDFLSELHSVWLVGVSSALILRRGSSGIGCATVHSGVQLLGNQDVRCFVALDVGGWQVEDSEA